MSHLRTFLLIIFSVFTLQLKAIERTGEANSQLAALPAPENIMLVLEGAQVYHGMFGVFLITLGTLDFYENGHFGGLHVNLNSGFYLEPEIGPNWWDYYFAPIAIIPSTAWIPYSLSFEQTTYLGFNTLFSMSRQRGYELIQKYVSIKPQLLHEVDHFVEEYFADNYVIGVHYRGTDKVEAEVERVSYEEMTTAIHEAIQAVPADKQHHYCIFIATDEQAFLDYITRELSCPIIYTQALRSNDGIAVHCQTQYSNYQKGKEALLDCLLLSRCHYLIHTESNLSRAAGFFNPSLPIRLMKTKWKWE